MHANVTWPKRYQVVFGRRMAYVESGVGDPIFFFAWQSGRLTSGATWSRT